MPGSWPICPILRERLGAGSPQARDSCTNATGRAYRGYHAITTKQGDQQFVLWVDIDEATRKQMSISLTQRREQMVGDGLQLNLDAEHWSNANSDEQPIQIPLDFTDDVKWRKNSPAED